MNNSLYIHYFGCAECGLVFSVLSENKNYSDAIQTTDGLVSCPNTLCGSPHVFMTEVLIED